MTAAPAYGPSPWLQRSWDARAAVNFAAGGTGAGVVAFAGVAGAPAWMLGAGAALVAVGLLAVWFEIGRPTRALKVFAHPRRSWMSREAIVALLLLAAVATAWGGVSGARWIAALAALGFLYCQARILQSARGIPAWRTARLVPLMSATGLAEGGGVFALLSAPAAPVPAELWGMLVLVLFARLVLWSRWRHRLDAPRPALAAIDAAGHIFKPATLLALAAGVVAIGAPHTAAAAVALPALACAGAVAGGWWFKFALVTRAAFTQGFALAHLPVRGVPRA
jgi:phenylacetyl-CoA:acceptor oxidoreductase subunit 2